MQQKASPCRDLPSFFHFSPGISEIILDIFTKIWYSNPKYPHEEVL